MKIQTKCKLLKWVVSSPYIPFAIRIKFENIFKKSVAELENLQLEMMEKLNESSSAQLLKFRTLGQNVVIPKPSFKEDRLMVFQDKNENQVTFLEIRGQTICLNKLN